MEGGRLEEARQAFSDAAAIEPLLPQALYNSGCARRLHACP